MLDANMYPLITFVLCELMHDVAKRHSQGHGMDIGLMDTFKLSWIQMFYTENIPFADFNSYEQTSTNQLCSSFMLIIMFDVLKERKKEKGKSSIDFIPTHRIACRQQAEIEVILLLLFSK